jgi:hypothetical protein
MAIQAPGSLIATAVLVAATKSVRAKEGNDLTVVESHTIEDDTDMVRALDTDSATKHGRHVVKMKNAI